MGNTPPFFLGPNNIKDVKNICKKAAERILRSTFNGSSRKSETRRKCPQKC